MKRQIFFIALLFSQLISTTTQADTFTVSSTDIKDGQFMAKEQEFAGFGCSGDNVSPQLSWSGAPKDTVAFAILVHDQDAPTGSGWWHWQVVNIPKTVNTLEAGAGNASKNQLPVGSLSIKNDYGVAGFGGACPPKGHGVHRYRFTVHALSKVLDINAEASGALTGYMVNAHSLASATIEALYKLD